MDSAKHPIQTDYITSAPTVDSTEALSGESVRESQQGLSNLDRPCEALDNRSTPTASYSLRLDPGVRASGRPKPNMDTGDDQEHRTGTEKNSAAVTAGIGGIPVAADRAPGAPMSKSDLDF